MPNSHPAGFTDLIGPHIQGVQLHPVKVSFHMGEPATPLHVSTIVPTAAPIPAPATPAFLRDATQAPNARPEDQAKSLPRSAWGISFSEITQEIIRPFNLRANSSGANLTLGGLSVFFVWMGYAAIPGLSDAMPLSSLSGFVYISTLIPASLFASSVVLATGRGLGWCMERAAEYRRQ